MNNIVSQNMPSIRIWWVLLVCNVFELLIARCITKYGLARRAYDAMNYLNLQHLIDFFWSSLSPPANFGPLGMHFLLSESALSYCPLRDYFSIILVLNQCNKQVSIELEKLKLMSNLMRTDRLDANSFDFWLPSWITKELQSYLQLWGMRKRQDESRNNSRE